MKLFKKELQFILFVILILQTNRSYSQWQQYPNTPNTNGFSVGCFDSQFFYVGANNAFIRTLNGGLVWDSLPLLDPSNNPFNATDFSCVKFISPTVGFASGNVFVGNSGCIFKTTNGGTNWTTVYIDNSSTWPRLFNSIHFASSTTGIAVGSNGTILRTIDGGSTWNMISSGTLNELFYVSFISSTTGFIAGNQKIFKTTDGGSSWTQTTFSSYNLKAIHFPTALTGYAVGNSKVIIKTTNGGTSWSPIAVNIPNAIDFKDVFFTSADTGYVLGGNYIFKTTNGGVSWEKHLCTDPVNAITFRTSNEGYVVGDNGTIYHTSNSGNPYHPISFFTTTPTTYCHDSTVYFNNLSQGTYSFQWRKNGLPVSTSYNYSTSFSNGGQSDTIALVSNNGSYQDTLQKILFIQPSLDINLQTATLSDSVCSGQTATIYVYNSELNVSYQLRRNTTNIGSAQTGNGSTLTFVSNAITINNDILNIKATKSITGCGSNTKINYDTIWLYNPLVTLTVYADPDSICKNQSTTVYVLNSQANVSYQLRKGTLNIGSPVPGNGGTLSFNTGALSGNSTFNILATRISNGCASTLTQTATVWVESVSPYFTLNSFNPEAGETIYGLNSTVNPGGSYFWNFGSGASPSTSTVASPSNILLNTPGVYDIYLVAISPNGCRDSVVKKMTVLAPSTPDACDYIQGASSNANSSKAPIGLTHDKDDNIIYWTCDPNTRFITYSNQGDSLLLSNANSTNYNWKHTLTKYNAKGLPMWTTMLRHNSPWTKLGDVTTDTAGNIYCCYYHGEYLDSVQIYSTDGKRVTIDPPHSGSYYRSVVIVKYNKDGIYQWHNTYLEYYTIENLAMKADGIGALYVGSKDGLKKYDTSNGLLLWSNTGNICADIEMDSNGFIWTTNSYSPVVYKYNSAGTFLNATLAPVSVGIVNYKNQYLKLDEAGNIYLAGRFSGKFIFNGDTLSDPGSGDDDLYICKMTQSGQQLWSHEFNDSSMIYIKGFDVKGENVYLLGIAGNANVQVGNNPKLDFPVTGNFLYKTDTSGSDGQISVPYLSSIGGWVSVTPDNMLFVANNSDRVSFSFSFANDFSYLGQTVSVYQHPPGTYNYIIETLDPDCYFPSIVPVANFSVQSAICVNQITQFNDQSINFPSSWFWSFPGGNPSTSTSPDPSVVYTVTGTYPVSLIASNSSGSSAQYNDTIIVSVVPSVTFTGNSFVCAGQNTSICASGGVLYSWNTGEVTSCISIIPISDTVYSVVVADGTCSNTASFNVSIDELAIGPVSVTNAMCSGCSDGSASAIVTGGIPPFTYLWSPVNQSSPTATNLPVGTYTICITDSLGCQVCDSVDISFALSSTSIDESANFSISPNPTSGIVNISMSQNIIETYVTDLTGRRIFVKEQSKNRIDISYVPSGIYFLHMKTEKDVIVAKVIKE